MTLPSPGAARVAPEPVGPSLSDAREAGTPARVPRFLRPRAPHRTTVLLARSATLLALLALWEFLARSAPTLRDSIPTASETGSALAQVVLETATWNGIGRTLQATFVGLALCVAVGVPLGVLIAASRQLVLSTRFLIDFFRSVPPLAIVPLFLLLLGPTARMEIALVVVVGVWPVLLQTMYGVRGVEPGLLQTARSFRLPRWRRAVFIVGPAAMPFVATGIRVCATLSLLLAIGTELIAGVPGLGQEILLSSQAGAAPRMFALIIVTGAIGAGLSAGITKAERRLLGWHYRPRATDG